MRNIIWQLPERGGEGRLEHARATCFLYLHYIRIAWKKVLTVHSQRFRSCHHKPKILQYREREGERESERQREREKEREGVSFLSSLGTWTQAPAVDRAPAQLPFASKNSQAGSKGRRKAGFYS